MRPASSPRIAPSALILAYLAGYAALHFFVTFQPWDRYLLSAAALSLHPGRAWMQLHGGGPVRLLSGSRQGLLKPNA